jgi:peptidoglycan L-alanyl-D-glutamate endopeptidase CwlK
LFGGPEIRPGVNRDPHLLLPGFADRVELLFGALGARGLWPLLWEGYRSPERALELSKRGTGIALSMHCLGAAVDVVHHTKLWSPPKSFWDALGEEAERLGLIWGGRFSHPDKPHVQAIPWQEEDAFRAMSYDQRVERVA